MRGKPIRRPAGTVVGAFTVLRKLPHGGVRTRWRVRCRCGVELVVSEERLAHSPTRLQGMESVCGCVPTRYRVRGEWGSVREWMERWRLGESGTRRRLHHLGVVVERKPSFYREALRRGLDPNTVRLRIKRGLSLEQAMELPLHARRPECRSALVPPGEVRTVASLAREAGVNVRTVYDRLKQGVPFKRAFVPPKKARTE